jgi:pyridoxamine 5'-phosphate oxidase
MKYKHLREEYSWEPFLETDAHSDPFQQFDLWFDQAIKQEPKDPNAMVLSTIDALGFPQARVVLLKEVDHGFVWFSNYGSEKGRNLAENPKAALTFWWPNSARQVRITGLVELLDDAANDAYFYSRPRGSQAGAIASAQSQILQGRDELDQRYQALMLQPEEQSFTRPAKWGGFRLIPGYFEFWQGRESRLHDRLFYRTDNGQDWTLGRLSP